MILTAVTITARNAIGTRAQVVLRWPRNVAQVKSSLSSRLFNALFLVLSENITINHVLPKTRFLGYNFVADSMGLTSTAQSYRIRWNNAKQRLLCCLRSFKVTTFGTNRKPVCHFLCVDNSNLHPIMHRFQDIAHCWSKVVEYRPTLSEKNVVQRI